MAIDNTPPRLKLIATIAVLTVTTLVVLDFAFKSYYAYMSDDAIRSKLAPTTDLDEEKKAEAAALAKANIDQAMAQIGKGPRAEIIAPQQSEDLGPMTGWAKMPKPAPAPQPHAPTLEGDAGATAADAGAAATATDAGVRAAGDGGVHDTVLGAGGMHDAGAGPGRGGMGAADGGAKH